MVIAWVFCTCNHACALAFMSFLMFGQALDSLYEMLCCIINILANVPDIVQDNLIVNIASYIAS